MCFLDARIVKFDEKSPATIVCPVYAIPGTNVTWEKDDGELPIDSKVIDNKLV